MKNCFTELQRNAALGGLNETKYAYCLLSSTYLENILLFWNISCAMSKVYLHFTVENAETPETPVGSLLLSKFIYEKLYSHFSLPMTHG